MTKHVPAGSLAAYAEGDLDDVTSWAVEAHVEGCSACMVRLGDLAGADVRALLKAAKAGLDASVLAGPRPARRHRWRRMARHWLSWSQVPQTVVTTLALIAAFLLEREYPDRPSLVLLLAPVAPLAGVASAWSRHGDVGWEVVAGTARAGLELLLRRSLVVLATVLPPLSAAGWMLGRSPALWLLPCLAFVSATLLLGSLIGVPRAAGVLGGGWLLAVAAPAVAANVSPAVIEPASVSGWAVAAI
jgi:hypothetical protein